MGDRLELPMANMPIKVHIKRIEAKKLISEG